VATWIKWLFYTATIALTIKFILQTISVIPSLSQLVFGFRPIIIAYLHLVLLGVYSLFLIGYWFYKGYLQTNKTARIGIVIFFIGVCLNECVLGIQGIAAFTYTPIPFVNEMLFGVACVLLLGASTLAISQARTKAIS
jgi:hypothetical protein